MNKSIFLLILFAGCSSIFAQIPIDTTDLKSLLVYGEDWNFWVREPDNWKGDIALAEKYQANIVFYKSTESFKESSILVTIRISGKVDENTEEDLKCDMKAYKEKHPKILFENIVGIKSKDNRYKCHPKLFYLPNKFCEYVTYINPGKEFNYICAVAMNKQKSKASKEELATYLNIIKSLWFTDMEIKK